jgi:hypothetical protein
VVAEAKAGMALLNFNMIYKKVFAEAVDIATFRTASPIQAVGAKFCYGEKILTFHWMRAYATEGAARFKSGSVPMDLMATCFLPAVFNIVSLLQVTVEPEPCKRAERVKQTHNLIFKLERDVATCICDDVVVNDVTPRLEQIVAQLKTRLSEYKAKLIQDGLQKVERLIVIGTTQAAESEAVKQFVAATLGPTLDLAALKPVVVCLFAPGGHGTDFCRNWFELEDAFHKQKEFGQAMQAAVEEPSGFAKLGDLFALMTSIQTLTKTLEGKETRDQMISLLIEEALDARQLAALPSQVYKEFQKELPSLVDRSSDAHPVVQAITPLGIE